MTAQLVKAEKTACVPDVSEFRFIWECSSTKLMARLKSKVKRAKPRRNLMTSELALWQSLVFVSLRGACVMRGQLVCSKGMHVRFLSQPVNELQFLLSTRGEVQSEAAEGTPTSFRSPVYPKPSVPSAVSQFTVPLILPGVILCLPPTYKKMTCVSLWKSLCMLPPAPGLHLCPATSQLLRNWSVE